MSSFKPKALFTVVATASFILLSGCGSTQTNVTSVGPSMVGPGGGQALGAQKKYLQLQLRNLYGCCHTCV